MPFIHKLIKQHYPTINQTCDYSSFAASPWQRLWGALPATLFIYFFRTASAFSITLPTTKLMDLSPYQYNPSFSISENSGILLFIELLHRNLPALQKHGLFCIGIALLYLLLIPFISMLWLFALELPGTISNSSLKAARCYHRSLLISLLCLFALLFTFSILLGILVLLRHFLWFLHSDRFHDLASLAAILPGLALILFIATLHDTSRAALCSSEHRLLPAIHLGFRMARQRSTIATYLFWCFCAVILTATGSIIATILEMSYAYSTLSALIILQVTTLGRTVLRGRWLAAVLVMVTKAQSTHHNSEATASKAVARIRSTRDPV